MARRVAALLGFIAVIALAVALLYRVYVHHTKAEPYENESVVVQLDAAPAGPGLRVA